MHQYYVLEIQQYQNGEFGHIVHFAFDVDPSKARLKGESKYYEVLSAAAVSDLPMHGAVLINAEGSVPIMYQSYNHGFSGASEPDEPDMA